MFLYTLLYKDFLLYKVKSATQKSVAHMSVVQLHVAVALLCCTFSGKVSVTIFNLGYT